MPHEIKFDLAPAGHVVGNSRKEDPTVTVQPTAFLSSEDGQDFVARLEGFPDDVLKMLPNGRWSVQSQIDHMLVVIRADNSATVYINEPGIVAHVRPSRDVVANEPLVKDDIADIESAEFKGITIPDDAGVMCIFSVGWRKGYFYDFAPLGPGRVRRTFNFNVLLGRLFSHVTFQERFAVLEAEWASLFAEKWFLFSGIPYDISKKMLNYVRAGWQVDEMADEIVDTVKKKAPSFLQSWRRHPTFSNHIEILDRAIERFLADDPMSCSGLLFPRIEGLMRSNYFGAGETNKPNSQMLSLLAVKAHSGRDRCLFLPGRFREYLEKVYFANFAHTDLNADISRHTVGHGVAQPKAFDQKAAAIAILVIHQLYYCFERPAGS